MAKKTKLKSVLTLLDVGTSKVCCMMVRFTSDGRPEVMGTGYAPAKGINAGAIVNLDQASESIRAALEDLEKQTERQVTSVVTNISSTQLKSLHIQKEIDISDGRPITASDVKRLVDGVVASCLAEGDEVIHAFPLTYTVDKEPGVSDPRGLYGHKLGVHMHVIVLPENQSRNLVAALDRRHVSIDMKVATPYASALATMTDEEKEIGATVVDFGAGHSIYRDKAVFDKVKKELKPFKNVVLLLPCKDEKKALDIMNARSTGDTSENLEFLRSPCNRELATMIVYAEGRSPQEISDEIISRINKRKEQEKNNGEIE